MAREVEWTKQAVDDLEAIGEFIERDSHVYASSFISQLYNSALTLSDFAERGRLVPEYKKDNTREIFVNEYRIIYEISNTKVFILTIIHGRRNLITE